MNFCFKQTPWLRNATAKCGENSRIFVFSTHKHVPLGCFCTASMFNKNTKDTKLTPNLNWRKSMSMMTSETCLRPIHALNSSALLSKAKESMLEVSDCSFQAKWKPLETFEVLQNTHVIQFQRVFYSLGWEFRQKSCFREFSEGDFMPMTSDLCSRTHTWHFQIAMKP